MCLSYSMSVRGSIFVIIRIHLLGNIQQIYMEAGLNS